MLWAFCCLASRITDTILTLSLLLSILLNAANHYRVFGPPIDGYHTGSPLLAGDDAHDQLDNAVDPTFEMIRTLTKSLLIQSKERSWVKLSWQVWWSWKLCLNAVLYANEDRYWCYFDSRMREGCGENDWDSYWLSGCWLDRRMHIWCRVMGRTRG